MPWYTRMGRDENGSRWGGGPYCNSLPPSTHSQCQPASQPAQNVTMLARKTYFLMNTFSSFTFYVVFEIGISPYTFFLFFFSVPFAFLDFIFFVFFCPPVSNPMRPSSHSRSPRDFYIIIFLLLFVSIQLIIHFSAEKSNYVIKRVGELDRNK